MPRNNSSLCGSRDADHDNHDGAAAVLAVLHDDHQQHDDHDGGPVRCRVLRLGLATIAWAVVADRVVLPVAMPVRNAQRGWDRLVSAGADAMHGDDDDNHEHDDEHDDDDHEHYDHDDVLPGL